MDMTELGVPTYHTRVERWECDYNNHWNARFYARSFQLAAEAIATPAGRPSAGASLVRSRHMRFHRELFVSAPVEVRSAALEGGRLDGAIVHLLTSAGELAATALDSPGGGVERLPRVSPDDVPLAMPRGIGPEPISGWSAAGAAEIAVSLGPIRPGELDHTKELLFEHIIRHSSVSSHQQLNHIGLTAEFSNRTGINRMGIEFLVRRGHTPPAGTPLYGQSKLLRVSGKKFWTAHRIFTAEDETVATIEQCLVVVDLNTRRAVEAPEFLHAALG